MKDGQSSSGIGIGSGPARQRPGCELDRWTNPFAGTVPSRPAPAPLAARATRSALACRATEVHLNYFRQPETFKFIAQSLAMTM